MSNITQVVNTDKNMTTLKKAVHASGLDQTLSATGPFTLFAPSDLAFQQMQPGVMDNLLQPGNKTELTLLMKGHVLNGKTIFSNLKDGDKLTTVGGQELLVTEKNGTVSINGATILNHDVRTSNGVIHSLDTVLMN